MRDGEATVAPGDLQTLFGVGAAGGLSDAQLLDRFVAEQEGVVFEAIVRRHGPMVWGVCRRTLRDHHDAEDAFQATFLVLARRASSIVPREQVGHWLYGVAYQTARKARATRARRRQREVGVPDLPEPAAIPRDSLDRSDHWLDRELSGLPKKYRVPIVLCELEGKSHREAAEQLGCPIGTVSGRLSRAKAMLARRLSRRGVTPSAGFAALFLGREAAAAVVPARLIGPTARAAVLIASRRTLAAAGVSSEVAALAEVVLNAMLMNQIKGVAALVLTTLILAAGGVGLLRPAPAADAPPDAIPGGRPDRRAAVPAEGAAPPTVLARADDRPASYAFKIDPKDVYEFVNLKVEYGDFRLEGHDVSVVPIATERGITGAMILGEMRFFYMPEGTRPIAGRSRATMLRFSPEEQATIVPLDGGKRVDDQGAAEVARHLLRVVIQHCWQSQKEGGRKQEVLIPPKRAFAAVVYSREHGDLLISFDESTAIAFNFTEGKTLYEKK